jgi:hypothetical protein
LPVEFVVDDLGELFAAVCEHVGDEVTGTSRDVEHD